jgi:hypothetical protein
MAWKRTKQFVTVAVTFGASKLRSLKLASGAPIVEWDSRLSSNTGILSAYRGKATSILLLSLSLCSKAAQFSRGYATAVTPIAVTRSI